MQAVSCPRCSQWQPVRHLPSGAAYQCPACGQLFRAPAAIIPTTVIVPNLEPASGEPPPAVGSLGRSYLHAVAIAAGVLTVIAVVGAGAAFWSRGERQEAMHETSLDTETRRAAQRALRDRGYGEIADIYRQTWKYPAVRLELTARKGERLHDIEVFMRHAQFGRESHFQIDLITVDGAEEYRRP